MSIRDIKMVTITEAEYFELKKDSEWLYYLDAAGVDNWSGISLAYELQQEDEEELS